MGNVWDFFKPDPSVEYPTVDGALSQVCYYEALEDCYMRFCDKLQSDSVESLADYWVFHSPYNKLVQKSYGRLFFLDERKRGIIEGDKEEKKYPEEEPLREYLTKPLKETYTDKSLEKILKKISFSSYTQRLSDATYASKLIGNTYTASVFLGLASLLDRVELNEGSTIGMFSYGSGAIATMYRLHVRSPSSSRFTLEKISRNLKLTERLSQRKEVLPNELDHALETRSRMHRAGAPYTPLYPCDRLFLGTYYLKSIDSNWVRTYTRLEKPCEIKNHEQLAPQKVREIAKREEVSTPVKGKLSITSESTHRVASVITGVSAGLPGSDPVFHVDNLSKLIQGKVLISNISSKTRQAMLEKNVVQLLKCPNGVSKKIQVKNDDEVIHLAGVLGSLDMTRSYGVPPGLAKTMDLASQVAVAAGLEALKDAGLVSGASSNLNDWKLPEHLCESTGIVYASSFPAMDAAVGEVMRFLQSKTIDSADAYRLILALRAKLQSVQTLTEEDERCFSKLLESTPKGESKKI